MLITVVLLLFELENKKELDEEIKSQWSALRCYKWQHSNYYIMPQPTDLFCHANFFAKFNMLTSFSLHFFANIEGEYIHSWIYPLKIKPWSKLWKHLYLKLIVKRFQRLCHVSPDLFIFVNFAEQIEDCIRKTPSTHYTSGVENFMQIQPFVISWMVTCTLMPWLQSSLKFTYLKVRLLEKVHFKMSFLMCWGRGSRVHSAWRKGAIEDYLEVWFVGLVASDKRELCMVPWYICHTYEICRSKEVQRGCFKVIIWGCSANHKG